MKVLCINADFTKTRNSNVHYITQFPKELETYTIREVVDIQGTVGYKFDEFVGGYNKSGVEISFDQARFVPLQDDLEETEVKEKEEFLEA